MRMGSKWSGQVGKHHPKLEEKHVCAWLRLRATGNGMPLGASAQGVYLLLTRYDEVGHCSGSGVRTRVSTIESASVPNFRAEKVRVE